MTDQEWCMQRMLAEDIFKAYLDWKDAKGIKKYKAEKLLCKYLAIRSAEEKSPRA